MLTLHHQHSAGNEKASTRNVARVAHDVAMHHRTEFAETMISHVGFGCGIDSYCGAARSLLPQPGRE